MPDAHTRTTKGLADQGGGKKKKVEGYNHLELEEIGTTSESFITINHLSHVTMKAWGRPRLPHPEEAGQRPGVGSKVTMKTWGRPRLPHP